MSRSPEAASVVGHGVILRRKIRFAEPWLAAIADEFWSHPRLRAMLPEYYIRVHAAALGIIDAMRVGLDRCRALAPHDPVAARLAPYFEQHIEDEVEHPDWLLADLEVLGVSADEVAQKATSAAVAGLVGPQYYWARHGHPIALLGYFGVLEGFPPTLDHLDRVEQATGYPRDAFRMLRAHATLDIEHADEIFSLLDELPLSPPQQSLLAVSAFETISRVCGVFRETLQLHGDGRD